MPAAQPAPAKQLSIEWASRRSSGATKMLNPSRCEHVSQATRGHNGAPCVPFQARTPFSRQTEKAHHSRGGMQHAFVFLGVQLTNYFGVCRVSTRMETHRCMHHYLLHSTGQLDCTELVFCEVVALANGLPHNVFRMKCFVFWLTHPTHSLAAFSAAKRFSYPPMRVIPWFLLLWGGAGETAK